MVLFCFFFDFSFSCLSDSLNLEGKDFDDQTEEEVVILPKEFAKVIENPNLEDSSPAQVLCHSELDKIFSIFDIQFEKVRGYLRGYLLAWALLLFFCQRDSQVRTNVGVYLRRSRKSVEFLNNLIHQIDFKSESSIPNLASSILGIITKKMLDLLTFF